MNKKSENTIQFYLSDIRTFRIRQFLSALLTGALFGIALTIAHFYLKLNLSNILWIAVTATILLTHAVFNQLGWKLRWGEDNLLLERMNEWEFRIIYSIGIILLFLTMMQ